MAESIVLVRVGEARCNILRLQLFEAGTLLSCSLLQHLLLRPVTLSSDRGQIASAVVATAVVLLVRNEMVHWHRIPFGFTDEAPVVQIIIIVFTMLLL